MKIFKITPNGFEKEKIQLKVVFGKFVAEHLNLDFIDFEHKYEISTP